MEQKPFREKSQEALSTPQQMNDYLRVSTPGVWVLLIGVLVLLAGALVWGVLGRLETLQPVAITAEDGQNICYIRADQADAIHAGSKVRIDTREYTVIEKAEKPILCEELDTRVLNLAELDRDAYAWRLKLDGEAVSNVVAGEAVLQSVAPISFLLQ